MTDRHLIKSGDITQRVHFLASTTGQAGSLTAWRKRGSGAWAAMTTPTFAEDDATHAPKMYSLLVDEDTTITTDGLETEEMVIYVAGGTIAALPIYITLYRNLSANLEQIAGTSVVGTGTSGDQWRGP